METISSTDYVYVKPECQTCQAKYPTYYVPAIHGSGTCTKCEYCYNHCLCYISNMVAANMLSKDWEENLMHIAAMYYGVEEIPTDKEGQNMNENRQPTAGEGDSQDDAEIL